MLLKVRNFCAAVSRDMNGLIYRLEQETSRPMTDREKQELGASYTEVAHMLAMAQQVNAEIADIDISTSNLLLEYHLPKASAWCDLVLLGKGESHPEVIIVELKNYRKNSETLPGHYEGLIHHNGLVRQHPAAQVRQYTLYCQHFHSTVVEDAAHCSGLVYFTQPVDLSPYEAGPNATLCQKYPLYNSVPQSASKLAQYVARTIRKPDDRFAKRFMEGDYKQDRNILKQVAESLLSLRNEKVRNPFVLLDGQDLGFSQVLATVEHLQAHQKEVVIVAGPPGSGKSAVAANLWVECARRFHDRGNVLFVTTSSSQYDPWAHTFENCTSKKEARGMVIKANAFNPGLNGSKIKNEIAPHYWALDSEHYFNGTVLRYDLYEEYLRYAASIGMVKETVDNHYLSIVDEAHALIDPSAPHFSTNKSGGWCYQAGPQAYHIIKQSRVSVFLMDNRQSFRDNETTSIQSIRAYAKKLGARVTFISLADMQFRCAGSKEYVDWVGRIFTPTPLHNRAQWKEKFEFKLVDSPQAVDEWLRSKQTRSIRVLSTYTREWKSRDTLKAIHGDCKDYDFELDNGDGTMYRKFWNNPTAYDIFVKATEGSTMHADPLSEIGCPYAVRGYDYDYVGVLSLSDLVMRNGQPMLLLDNCQETATGSKRKVAREESGLKKPKELVLDKEHPHALEYASTIAQAYRILLTRGIKGVCVYVEDKETREYLENLLNE